MSIKTMDTKGFRKYQLSKALVQLVIRQVLSRSFIPEIAAYELVKDVGLICFDQILISKVFSSSHKLVHPSNMSQEEYVKLHKS